MGRMKKAHKIITTYKLTLTYICPVTEEEVSIDYDSGFDLSHSESECDLCGSHGHVGLDLSKCKSCGKFHDDIELTSW